MTETKPWHEDESFWKTWGPVMFSAARVANATKEVEQIVSLADISPESRILDLCCGIGRHSLELARRGFKVTGVDRTQEYLEQAAEQAKREGLDVEFVREDMRAFLRPDSFDTAINLFTSFGYFDDPSEDRNVLENVCGSLRSGGVFILDMTGKEILARIFRERDWNEANGVIWLEERKVLNDWSRIEARWTMFKDNRRYEHRLNHRLFSASELKALLAECGFGEVKVYGDFDGGPYDHTARRLVAVAHKGMKR